MTVLMRYSMNDELRKNCEQCGKLNTVDNFRKRNCKFFYIFKKI